MNSTSVGLAPRERAHTIVHEVLDRRRPLDDVLRSDRQLAKLNERDRAFARNLVATTLRRLGQIDALLDDCLVKPLPRPASAARNAMRLGACQLLFLDTQTHAAVDTSVALTARRGPERYKAVVNAVLRRISRETGPAQLAAYPERLNMPDWLYESWSQAHGADAAAAIAAACQIVPPVDISVKNDTAGWADRLGGAVLTEGTVRLERAGDIVSLPGFETGDWWVQDAAAALPARVLLSGLRKIDGNDVGDFCAAPGGKTAQLAAAGLDVTAIDLSAARLSTVRENLDRLGLSAKIIEADLLEWSPEHPFSAVLLDAPCTATGTVRRHPDIPYLKKPSDVGRQSALQRDLLERTAQMVKPGGLLVYSVCSLQPEEGRQQIDAFLGAHDIYERNPIEDIELPAFAGCLTEVGDVVTLPSYLAEIGGTDGFYIARLKRRA